MTASECIARVEAPQMCMIRESELERVIEDGGKSPVPQGAN
jgi:hypothetical protein